MIFTYFLLYSTAQALTRTRNPYYCENDPSTLENLQGIERSILPILFFKYESLITE